jgi:antitoxin HigA-1
MKKHEKTPRGPEEVTPGEILHLEFMEPMGKGVRQLAREMHVSPIRVSEIIRGKRAITAETALRLATVFETSAQFWMNIQVSHDLAIASIKERKRIKKIEHLSVSGLPPN